MFFLSSVCESSGVLKIIKFIGDLLNIVCIVVPIGLILILSLDLGKAVIANDEQAMDKSKKMILKRMIFAVLLFLVPSIVRMALTLVDDSSTLLFKNYDSCISNVDNIEYYEKIEKTKEEKQKQERLKKQKENLDKLKEEQSHAIKEAYGNRENAPVTTANNNYDDITVGKNYTLSESDWKKLTTVCIREQGTSEKGIKAEASLIANRYDASSKKKFKNIYDYVKNSNWFASTSFRSYNVSKRQISYVKSVVEKGNRIFPLYVNEHDCIKCSHGITKIKTNGKVITSESGRTNRKNYIKHKTTIYNFAGATYTFYEFPTSTSDPFGYTKSSYKRVTGKG